MFNKLDPRFFLATSFVAATLITAASTAQANSNVDVPTMVTTLKAPAYGIESDSLAQYLEPLGYGNLYSVDEKIDAFQVVVKDRYGKIKHVWLDKMTGKTVIY